MILRLLLLAVQAFIIVSVDPLVRVEGDQNNSRLTIARNKHISSTSQNEENKIGHSNSKHLAKKGSKEIILSLLEGQNIITKENLYNGELPKHEDQIYANFLRNTYSTEIDLLFVTPPPQRTTVAYKKQWKKKREEKDNLKVVEEQDKNYIKKIEIKEKIRTSLRLVTLSRATTTPLPPFKHTAQNQVALHHEIISFRPAHYSDMDQTSGIRFPAQPWQIPPRNTERFTEIGIDDGLIEIQSGNTHPQNPFLLTTVPPMNTGINLTYPFLPIGTSNLHQPLFFQRSPVNQYAPQSRTNSEMVHKSPLRAGSYSRNRNIPAIPLLLPLGHKLQPVNNQKSTYDFRYTAENNIPDSESLIDDKIHVDKTNQLYSRPVNTILPIRNNAIRATDGDYLLSTRKEFSGPLENSSEQLRSFAKQYPSVVHLIKNPATFMGTQTTFTKSYVPHTPPTGPAVSTAISPVTTLSSTIIKPLNSFSPQIIPSRPFLNPNQKIELCCKKQAVNPACQALCNFDSFNDKTLVSAFLTNQCPGPQLGQAYDCASSKADHSACCERAGLTGFQGGRCLSFCQTHKATPANVFDYLGCLQVFEHIKGCYREYQATHPNIFGD